MLFELICAYDSGDPEILFEWFEFIGGEWVTYCNTRTFDIIGVTLADNGRQFKNVTTTPSGEFTTNTATLYVSE